MLRAIRVRATRRLVRGQARLDNSADHQQYAIPLSSFSVLLRRSWRIRELAMLLTTKRRPRRESGISLPRPDGRTVSVRRYNQLVRDFEIELGGGPLSTIDMALLGQAAALVVRSEAIQTAIVAGREADTDEAVRLASESRRILASLTTRAAKAKPAGHDPLAAHLKSKYGVGRDADLADDDIVEEQEA
jgi:hypothetical protein